MTVDKRIYIINAISSSVDSCRCFSLEKRIPYVRFLCSAMLIESLWLLKIQFLMEVGAVRDVFLMTRTDLTSAIHQGG